jgi:hypothetical protein
MAIESDGHSRGNPRIYELIENAPKTGKSPTIWAWPEVVDWLRVAGQPVPGPWPPHQRPRPNPEDESLPVAVAEPPRPQDTPTNVGSQNVGSQNVGSNVGYQDSAPRHSTERSHGDPPLGRGLMDID